MARAFVRIRIYKIIGFSGFSQSASAFGKRLSILGLDGLPVMAKSAGWAKRNPENPIIPQILILTKARASGFPPPLPRG